MSASLFLLNSWNFPSLHLFWIENVEFKVLNVVDLNFESSASAIEFDLFLFRYLTIDFLSVLAVQAVDLEILFIRRKREIDSNDWSTHGINPFALEWFSCSTFIIFPNASIYNFLGTCNILCLPCYWLELMLPKVSWNFYHRHQQSYYLKLSAYAVKVVVQCFKL